MQAHRSFADYVKQRFDNDFWAVAESYLESNIQTLDLEQRRIHRAGDYEITNVNVEYIWVEDKPEMEIHFDVALSIWFDVHEGNYHYDDYDEHIVWIIAHCRGDLDKNLDDFEILNVSKYNGKSRPQNPMDDSLVPIIPYDNMDEVATAFLTEHYPAALSISKKGQPPVWVDPTALAKNLGLSVQCQRIRKDASVFGQLYFDDTDTIIYDEVSCTDVMTHINGKTILVDPQMYYLRNLGSVNNTIIHECVHWAKHRKAFKLEQLFNANASHISCEVLGSADSRISLKVAEYMEKQANQLTPRIQMPKTPFIVKAKEYINEFFHQTGAKHTIDVMEMVICALEKDFAVSRQAVKIRLVELGFEEAIGTFTFVDGHYVKPHGFRKGAISINQTFTISAQDAAIQRFFNAELREKTANGDYLFIDNHFVYNAPLYVVSDENGKLQLSDYARSHMDECCLVFDMSITSKVESIYYTACFLNREPSNVTFEVKYHNGYENAPQERQIAMRKKEQAEWIDIRRKMTDDPEQCMELLLDWKNMNYTDLGAIIERDPKTISRIVKGTTTPKLETAVLICFAMHLPPVISEKLLEVLGCKLKTTDSNHQWINEALHTMYPESIDSVRTFLNQFDVII